MPSEQRSEQRIDRRCSVRQNRSSSDADLIEPPSRSWCSSLSRPPIESQHGAALSKSMHGRSVERRAANQIASDATIQQGRSEGRRAVQWGSAWARADDERSNSQRRHSAHCPHASTHHSSIFGQRWLVGARRPRRLRRSPAGKGASAQQHTRQGSHMMQAIERAYSNTPCAELIHSSTSLLAPLCTIGLRAQNVAAARAHSIRPLLSTSARQPSSLEFTSLLPPAPACRRFPQSHRSGPFFLSWVACVLSALVHCSIRFCLICIVCPLAGS